MGTDDFIGWCGRAAVGGGVLVVVATVVELVAYGSTDLEDAVSHGAWVPATVVSLAGFVLVTLGLVGSHLHQAEVTGRQGLAAFVVTFAGMSMAIGFIWVGAFVLPALDADYPDAAASLLDDPPATLAAGYVIALALFGLGWLYFGIVTLRAGVFSRVQAQLLIIGVVVDLILSLADISIGVGGLAGLVWVAAIMWMGATTISTPRVPAHATT